METVYAFSSSTSVLALFTCSTLFKNDKRNFIQDLSYSCNRKFIEMSTVPTNQIRASQTHYVEMQAIPTIWISDNNCLWPRYTSEKLLKAIKRCEPPLSSWEEHEISTFRNATYDNYATARKKCQKAEDTSDLNSDMELRRVIKPPSRLRSSSESSSNDSEVEINLSLLKERTSTAMPQSPSINLKKPTLELVSEKINLTKEHQCTCCSEHKTIHSTNNKLLKQIIRKITLLEITTADIRTEIGNLHVGALVETQIDANIWAEFDIPLKSNEELLNFEGFLKSEQNMTKSVSELSKLGGDTVNKFIRRGLLKLISNRLASEYSWLGLKKNFSSKNPKTRHFTVSEIENSIKKYLRRAKERADAEGG